MLERLSADNCKADDSGWGKAGWNDEDFSSSQERIARDLREKMGLTSHSSSQLQDVKPAESIQKSMYHTEKMPLQNTANTAS